MVIITTNPVAQKANVPLVGSVVKAGFPSPADDYIESSLNLHDEVVEHPASTIFVRVSGDSMIGAGINDGDTLVVDKSLSPTNGSTVIAVLNGEFTVKLFYRTNKGIVLTPANPNYSRIIIQDTDDFEVWGIVTYTVRKLKRS